MKKIITILFAAILLFIPCVSFSQIDTTKMICMGCWPNEALGFTATNASLKKFERDNKKWEKKFIKEKRRFLKAYFKKKRRQCL